MRCGGREDGEEKGRWDFDNVSLLWDNTERYGEFGDASGYLSPGLKERTISIDREDEHSYGYVLLQMLTVDGAEPTLISSRVLCVPPLTGDPLLEFDMTDSFMPSVPHLVFGKIDAAFGRYSSGSVREGL